MTPEAFNAVKAFFQLVSAILAVIFNCLLIILIITKSPVKMGTYRHLMCFLCSVSVIFAVLDNVVEPNIYSQGSAFFMIMDLRNRSVNAVVAELLIDVLCGCCGFTIYGIVVHFVYRFFALERRGRLRYFQWPYLILWLVIPLIGGFHWTLVCWLFFHSDPIASDYLQPTIREVFHIPIESVAYATAIFWMPNPEGIGDELTFSWRSGWGLLNILLSLGISFSLLITYGFKSWMKIKELAKQGESKYTRNLQMQLYKALVAQTIIPVLLLFLPFGILFICPLFLIDCSFLAAGITFIYAIYPALDPLPILFLVDDYRNAVGDFCCKTNQVSDSNTGPVESRDNYTI